MKLVGTNRNRCWNGWRAFALAVILSLTCHYQALALITGGEGNSPITDPGWPTGAAAVFNHPRRVAWWEGPPLGGGQWHAECRGDTAALNQLLSDFAKIEVTPKRIVVHSGIGHSFWLNPNREPTKRDAAKIDWVFMVWQSDRLELFRNLPADLTGNGQSSYPCQLDVYTGGLVRWQEVRVPDGVEVVDERLEARGFSADDGAVLEGTVRDAKTSNPLVGNIELQRIEPQAAGGYRYPVAGATKSDAQGRWVLKRVAPGGYRIVATLAGYVPRVVDHVQLDEQPGWRSFNTTLAPAMQVSGRVISAKDAPLAEVQVRLSNIVDGMRSRYQSPDDYVTMTDNQGRFRFEAVPEGKATIRLSKAGWCKPGSGLPITVPASDILMDMVRAASLTVTVNFGSRPRPPAYVVHVEPKTGARVGEWSGAGNIDASNKLSFSEIPPGEYVIVGQPNPGSVSERTPPLQVQLRSGDEKPVTLKAR